MEIEFTETQKNILDIIKNNNCCIIMSPVGNGRSKIYNKIKDETEINN